MSLNELLLLFLLPIRGGAASSSSHTLRRLWSHHTHGCGCGLMFIITHTAAVVVSCSSHTRRRLWSHVHHARGGGKSSHTRRWLRSPVHHHTRDDIKFIIHAGAVVVSSSSYTRVRLLCQVHHTRGSVKFIKHVNRKCEPEIINIQHENKQTTLSSIRLSEQQ